MQTAGRKEDLLSLKTPFFMASVCSLLFWLFLPLLPTCISFHGGKVRAFESGSQYVKSGQARTPGSASNELHPNFDYVNIPRVRSFNLSDGSIVDCVPIERQLSLKHPSLQNHQIQLAPSLPESASALFKTEKELPSLVPWQLFHVEHGSCPDGSIPVHRLACCETRDFHSPDIFLKKYPTEQRGYAKNSTKGSRTRMRIQPPAVDDGHQYAIVESVGNFAGAQAYLSVWDPSVATASDFSLSQLWVGAGAQDDINTVEAGWQVYELLNGDRNPHLFIFWTADSYRSSGCYNLRCPGFVQTNSRVVLGGAISSVSSPDSSLYFKKFLVYKDPSAWWLQIDGEWVGYWPAILFTTLKNSADWLQWGGEVCLSAAAAAAASGSSANGSSSSSSSSSSTDESQITTEMGSGYFPTDGNTKAASQCELGYIDTQLNVYAATDLRQFSTDPNCYSAATYYDDDWGSYIVFGGTGC
ncbi:hypothetical protein O6H91_12G042200 [Diphasiastrum complanatum]|uniref:Uncharacterized protein n=1 Tax=Diphasiastrum complanatum TaxID=34168 RepID=A0ACC2C0X9_DIPCM|nr:hypothetical protein O6H91_12G042200 [Diphasiastrum complanatum]